MSVVLNELLQRLPEDAVCTIGAGNHTIWAQRFFPTNVFPSQLATRNGSMGYSVPSAVAAGLESPERLVVAVCGDGEFLMNGQELATAAQYGVPVLGIVMDNGQFATIRDHQEKHFPGRVSGTQLSNPDFAALVRAFDGHAETVASDAEAAGAVERALKAVTDQRRSALASNPGPWPSGPPMTKVRFRPSCCRSLSHFASCRVVRDLPRSSSATR